MANTIEVFFTPIDKVSNEVWAGVAQRKTLEAKEEKGTKGYPLSISSNPRNTTMVNLAVWNMKDCIVLNDANGHPVLDKEGIPVQVLAQLKNPLSEWDRCVHDAIVSIVVAGKKYFTPTDILRVLYGKTHDKKFIPTEEQVRRVNGAVWKISETKILLKFKDEAIKMSCYRYSKSKKYMEGEFEIRENLLPIKEFRMKGKNGLYAIGYEYDRELNNWDNLPALYRYSSPKKQVAKIDLKNNDNLLNTPVRKEDMTITIEHYLHRKINFMYNKNVANSLHIETILKDLGFIQRSIDELDKSKRNKIYQRMESILNFWKVQGTFIADWKWESVPRKITETIDARNLKKGKLVIILLPQSEA